MEFCSESDSGGQMSYHRLEKFLADVLLPAFFGTEVTNEERDLFSLPSRLGGLGVFNPEKKSGQSYVYSRRSCQSIIGAIKGLVQFEIQSHLSTIAGVKSDYKKSIELNYEEDFNTVIVRFDKNRQRAINRSKDGRLSGWLTVLPIAKFHFDLSPQEFRDALALRYKKPLLRVPDSCDGCGASFDLVHALDCRKGGLVIQRHNKVRDAFGDLGALVWHQVKKEPIVKEANDACGSQALIADLAIRGVWETQEEALFDIRVTDTDAKSYLTHSPNQVLAQAEKDKKLKYGSSCEERRAVFTPLCVSVDGLFGKETEHFVKKLVRVCH